jgi:1,6-anhydro-N-acetylmuramate kinase
MRAIKGNIGAETAEKCGEKVVVKQKDNAGTSPDRLNAEAVGFFAAEAQIKRRC